MTTVHRRLRGAAEEEEEALHMCWDLEWSRERFSFPLSIIDF